jgi:putative membrane protein
MKRLAVSALVVAACLAGCAQLHNGSTRTAAVSDPVKFASRAAADRAGEEALARLALQRAKSAEVKQYAQKVLDDDLASDRQLETLAAQTGGQVGHELSPGQRESLDTLAGMARSEFDRHYMDAVVSDTEDQLRTFELAAAGPVPAVAQYARQTLPTMRDHLNRAENVDVLVGGGLANPTGHGA